MGSIGEKHLSRLAAPRHWPVARRGLKWIARPRPGAHSIRMGIPLNIIIRDLLGYAKNNREVKHILNNQEVLVDGRRRKEPRFNVGLMDVVSLLKTEEYFRVLFNKRGKIVLLPLKEAESRIKPCKIIGKRLVKGKMQINLYDGKNILSEGDYRVGDSLLVELPELKIKEVLPLKKGSVVYLMAGRHVGEVGQVHQIKEKIAVIKIAKGVFETLKKYCFVIGKEKPAISIIKDER